MQIFGGIVGVVLSLLLVIYRVRIKHFIGEIGWAERYFGSGGTFTALLLFGIVGFFISLMVMTGSLDLMLGGIGEKFFGSSG